VLDSSIVYLLSYSQQLHKCADEFTELDNKYQQLTRSSFDADSATLDNIELYLWLVIFLTDMSYW